MSKFKFVRRCCNCGAILQCEHPEEEGYIEEQFLQKDLSAMIFCASCYASAKYNLMPAYPTLDENFLVMLQDAQARDALIVYVVDLFSFECSFIPEIVETISGLPMIVVANKRDLLPTSVSDASLKEYVAHRFRRAKIQVTHEDVLLTSFTSLSDTSNLAKMIQQKRAGHDVYIIGAVGAGKTLFLNAFLRNYENKTRRSIRRADYPDTKLAVLEIPLDNSSSIYDTPGTSLANSVLSILDEDGRKVVMPKIRVKSRKISLSQSERLFIGGIARIELMSKERCAFKCYFSEEVTLAKHHTKREESVTVEMMKKKGNVPQCSKLNTPSDFDVYEIHVDETGDRDIGIEGLGWFAFEGNKQIIRVFVPKGIGVYTSRSKIH